MLKHNSIFDEHQKLRHKASDILDNSAVDKGNVKDALDWLYGHVGAGYWDRTGTTLTPHTPNDNIDIGVGSVTAGNITSSGDVELTDSSKGVILKSPNGTKFRVKIDNDGILTVEEVV